MAEDFHVGPLMTRRLRKYAQKIAIAIALLGLAAWIAPAFFSVRHYRRRLRASLERSLGRPVKFKDISFHLLPLPGFTITDAVIGEAPPFGPEPFAEAGRVDCDLRWRSLWERRLDVSRLVLDHASLDLVRDPAGKWNIGNLLERSQRPAGAHSASGTTPASGGLDIEANNARLNFKVGPNTKPLAVTDLEANVHFDPRSGQVSFRLTGSPVRTDLSIPTPGPVKLSGEWTPSSSPGGELNARLETHGALLYDWIPLISGHNLGLYGLLDSDIRLTGSLHDVRFQGVAELAQLHRWEALPPSKPMPMVIHLRGNFNRAPRKLQISSLDARFGHSRLHLSGAIVGLPFEPRLNLVAALERSHLQDILELARRVTGKRGGWGISGSVNGMIAVQGRWDRPRWGGFLTAGGERLTTPAADFPVSGLAVRIDHDEARVAPFRILLAPHVEASAAGEFSFPTSRRERGTVIRSGSGYELRLSANAVPLSDLLRFGRDLGWEAFRHVTAEGVASVNLSLSGKWKSLAAPELIAHARLEGARLFLPGLTAPINLPRAKLEVVGNRIVADPVVGVIGTSVFSGRLEHRGLPQNPWHFSMRANHLSLEQAAGWFEALRAREPLALLRRLPGLGPILERREAASGLFSRLNARGSFATSDLRYRDLNLRRFRAHVEIRRRVIRITQAAFRAGGGHGSGMTVIDLAQGPARLNARLELEEARVRAIAPILSPQLAGAQGSYSLHGQLEARGLSGRQIADSLRGSGTIRVENLGLGNFDLLGALARSSGLGALEPLAQSATIAPLAARFEIRDRRIWLKDTEIKIGGATVTLAGSYRFDGAIRLNVQADLRRLDRPWLSRGAVQPSSGRLARLDLTGTFAGAMKTPQWMLPAIRRPNPSLRRETF